MKNKYLLKAPPDFFQACDVRFSDFKMGYAINSHLWALVKIIYDQNKKYENFEFIKFKIQKEHLFIIDDHINKNVSMK